MSITSIPQTNYMSHDFIDAWMEARTEDAYGNMRDGMDVSGRRLDAEKALNDIKAELAQLKKSGANTPPDFGDTVRSAMKEYGDVPGVSDALKELKTALEEENVASTDGTGNVASDKNPGVKLDGGDIDNWSKQIDDCVDYLGKQDQLGMLNLNQLNSEINRTEQTATAIKDSRNKTAEAIINRIG